MKPKLLVLLKLCYYSFISLSILKVSSTEKISPFQWNYLQYAIKARLERTIERSGVKSRCATDLKAFVTDIMQRKHWSLHMLDASGKIQPGLMSGNIIQMGHYDQCLAIEELRNGSIIKGQYCSVVILPGANVTSDLFKWIDPDVLTDFLNVRRTSHIGSIIRYVKMVYGVCLPHTCSIQHLQKIWETLEHSLQLPVHVIFMDQFCIYKGKPVEPLAVDVYVFTFFGVYIGFILLATLYDFIAAMRNVNSESSSSPILRAFSLHNNVKRLFNTTKIQENIDENQLKMLDGLKVISMFWMVLSHRVFMNMFVPNMNTFYIFEWKRTYLAVWLLSGQMAVDTYFTISGILLCYTFLKRSENGSSIKLWVFYAVRIVRLNIPLAVMVLFYTSILKHINYGPFWLPVMNKISISCQKTWWVTLLHLSNYLEFNEQCIDQSWFLSVDTQLYILSPMILYNIRKSGRPVVRFILLAIVLSGLYTFYVTLKYEYGSVFLEGSRDYYKVLYVSTFVRMPSWLIGILCGYVIYNVKANLMHIPKLLNLLLWFVALLLLIGISFIHRLFVTNAYNMWTSAIFNAVSRPLWSLAISWITVACHLGSGGPVNRFLSLPQFRLVARLTYAMYLLHPVLIWIVLGGRQHIGHFNNIELFHAFWGDLVYALSAAIIFTLCFEAPFLTLTKMYYNKSNAAEAMEAGNMQIVKTKHSEEVKSTTDKKEYWTFSVIGVRKTVNEHND